MKQNGDLLGRSVRLLKRVIFECMRLKRKEKKSTKLEMNSRNLKYDDVTTARVCSYLDFIWMNKKNFPSPGFSSMRKRRTAVHFT